MVLLQCPQIGHRAELGGNRRVDLEVVVTKSPVESATRLQVSVVFMGRVKPGGLLYSQKTNVAKKERPADTIISRHRADASYIGHYTLLFRMFSPTAALRMSINLLPEDGIVSYMTESCVS